MTPVTSTALTVRPLGPDTWDAYARLIERHGGVWGGCWCTWFHPDSPDKRQSAEGNRALKQRLVCEGKAHAAVVFDGDTAVGWCQYGTPAELPNIHHRREYEAAQATRPDYRLTCIFVDRAYRRRGVAGVALHGALELIAGLGGGTVEGYPHDVQGRKKSASFLYNGTRTLYERAGFTYLRPKGQGNCVMGRVVDGLPSPAQVNP